MAAYHEWAEHYDHDLIDELAYVAPLAASKMLNRYTEPSSTRLLDAGCGTGLVGECLRELGYANIDGIDYCKSMLNKAKEKQVYNSLIHADLTSVLDLADDHYDAAICVGTFTCGHIGPGAFHELIRVVKPGGYICFTVRDQAWQEEKYGAAIQAVENKGEWKLMEENVSDYIQQEGSLCKICLYQVTK